MQIEVTEEMIDWYDSVKHADLSVYPERILQSAIGRALEKEKLKLPVKVNESGDILLMYQVKAVASTLNQLIDYLKAKENERIIEP